MATSRGRPAIVTIDLGTTDTKATLWWVDDEPGFVSGGRAGVRTSHPAPGWSEQDPADWLTTIASATQGALGSISPRQGSTTPDVRAVVLTGARQTFVPVDAGGIALGPALLWSDHRGAAEAVALADAIGGQDIARLRTGHPVDAGAMAAKIAWLRIHQAGQLGDSVRWLLSPRDFVGLHLTGQAATDPTMASRSGLYELGDSSTPLGEPIEVLLSGAGHLLPPVRPTGSILGELVQDWADRLGVPAGIPVVIGPTDRAAEALGSAATLESPMVSWGTTASVTALVADRPPEVPPGLGLTRGANRDWLVEAGLSTAGGFIDWLSRLLTGNPVTAREDSVGDLAFGSRPGANGALALPWLDGARAPEWNADARGAFGGLTMAQSLGDLARAGYEGVAREVALVLEAMAALSDTANVGPITLGGGGGAMGVWVESVTGISGRTALHRRVVQAASVGAALVGISALAGPAGVTPNVTVDDLSPVFKETQPAPELVAFYREWRERADALAATVIALPPPPKAAT